MRPHDASKVLLGFLVWVQVVHAAPLVGDFDGDDHTDIGIWDSTHVRALLDSTVDGCIDGITPALGVSTDIPFVGDWDGNGVQSIALYRRSTNQVIWTNDNTSGTYSARAVVAVGVGGGVPVRGDWNGDGQDGFAIYDITTRNFTFYQTISGAQFTTSDIGNAGDLPITGDWDNDGRDGYGVYRPSTRDFWLFNEIGGALTTHIPSVGNSGDLPLTGRWHGHVNWSVGLYRPSSSQFFLYDTLSVTSLQSIAWLDPSSVISTDGRQTIYTGGVPHFGAAGALRMTFDATDSFLPLGIYGIGDPDNELGQNTFAELQSAGFNLAQTWPSMSVSEAITESSGTSVRLIPRFSSSDVSSYDSDQRIFAWYVWDEPRGSTTLATLQELYGKYEPIASHPLFHTSTPPGDDPFWPSIAALGDAGAADDYPIHTPALGTLSIASIANTMNALRAAMPPAAPVWFVPQAFASNNPGDSWDMPATNTDQYRAMVYAAFVHGASGLLSFARDGFVMRNGGNLGISPHPVDTYPNCTFGSVPCLTPSASAKALAQNAWTAVSHVNAELAALKPALLSPTSTINYTVDVLQTPNNGTSPIRTLLKTAPDGMYLIAVNLINDNLDAVIQLPLASVTAAAVQFENRSVSTPTGAIRDQFGPFAVHIYKW